MPRNVLSIPIKTSPLSSSQVSNAIRDHIDEAFHDTHPDAFKDDLRELSKVRDQVVRLEVHVASIEAAQRYNAQLVFMGTKFPADVNIAFAWTVSLPTSLTFFGTQLPPTSSPPGSPSAPRQPARAYASTSGSTLTVAQPDIHYERAAVLFSLAALSSAIGASESRGEGESIKRAIAAFQSAAGILNFILNSIHPQIAYLFKSYKSARCVDTDLKPAMLASLRETMLAQAQECFWQKAVLDRLKDATIAKLALAASDFYARALDIATEGVVPSSPDDLQEGCELPREWINHMTVKRWHFAAAAQYRKSLDDLGANRYGDEISRLKLAEQHVKKALDSSKRDVSEAIVADLKSLQGVLTSNIARATKDNDLIYLEPVTPAAQLAPITAAVMVQEKCPLEVSNPIPLLRDSPKPAFGRPLFQELVPYGVHLALSVYEDRKDTLIRDEIATRREELDGIATTTLQSLNLPGSLQALEQPVGLPPSLVRKSDEIRSEGGLGRIDALLDNVRQSSKVDADILAEVVAMLEDDAGRRPPDQAWHHFTQRVQEFQKNLADAASADATVREKLEESQDSIGILEGGTEALEAAVPSQHTSVFSSATALDPQAQKQSKAVRALRVELEGLDDLLDSRASILAEAKAVAGSDDIRPTVMREAGAIAAQATANGGGSSAFVIKAAHFEPLFEEQIQKYAKFKDELDLSESDQAERLERIRQRNDDFVESRNVDASVKRRERALQTLDAAHQKYREIESHLVEGIGFYNQLAKLLNEVRQQVREWNGARQMEGQLADAAARMSLQQQQQQQQVPQAAPSASNTPGKRRTRAQARAEEEKDVERHLSESIQQQARQQGQTPQRQWGAWQGGDIRFGD